MPADDEDAFTVGSISLANQPAVIPLGNFIGDVSPASSVWPDFIAAIREDVTAKQSVAYLYVGGPSPSNFVVDDTTPALKIPGLILSASGDRRAIVATPGDYNHDGRDDLAVAITRLPGATTAVDKEGVYILFGRPTPWSGELDLVANADVVITGMTGAASVANAGDINGDGIDDLVIGDQGGNFASVFYGRGDWSVGATPLLTADFSAAGAPSLDGFVIDNAVPSGAPPEQVPGLWHLTARRATESGHTAPHSLYFGVDATGNYNVGQTAGQVTSPVISLAGVSGAELSFNYVLLTEPSADFDRAEVQLSVDGAAYTPVMSRTLTGNALLSNTASWTNATFNLAAYRGHSVQFRFAFDTVDAFANAFEGWYIDDVVVRRFFDVANPDVKFTNPVGTVSSVAGVGDVNGDGRDDLAVLRSGAGADDRVWIVFGRAAGSPFIPPTMSLDATGVAGATVTTTSDFNLTGYVVRPAGDVDNDGRHDVLVSGTDTSYLLLGSTLTGPVALVPTGLRIPAGGVVGLGNVNAAGGDR
ncbi:MAG: hypothetical protein E6K12_10680, partial [Methanobacteriota archaeon]